MNLITNFNVAEVSNFYVPIYVLLEKTIIGIILIFPALLSLKYILKKEDEK